MWTLAVLALLALPWGAHAQPDHLELFGYYSYDSAQEGHVNMTFLHQGPARPGLPWILRAPFDMRRPNDLDTETLREWFRLATGGDASRVLAVHLADEPELNTPLHQAEFDASVRAFRVALPAARLWVNFSTLLAQIWPGYRPSIDLDWVSVDNNGDTPPAAMPWFRQLAWPHQRFLMLPPGLRGLTYKDEPSMVAAADAVYAYAQSDPSVVGLIVFGWHDAVGAVGVEHLPSVRANLERIGREIIAEPAPALFNDVPDQFAPWVDEVARAGVMVGCHAFPPLFCPDAPVTRGEASEAIVRAAMYPAAFSPSPPAGIFADVSILDPRAPWVEALYGAGITSGCTRDPLRYCPDELVTREQVAVLLLRARHGPQYEPPPAQGVFVDVAAHDMFAPWIEQLGAEGITSGCGGGRYCPHDPVTRAELAVFLVRSLL